MDRQLDECSVVPTSGETVAGFLPSVAAPVVHDPEHPVGRRVGLGAHHLIDEPPEGPYACLGLATAEDPGPVHVPGGQVLQCPAPLVLELDPLRAFWRRRQGLVAAHTSLDRGLLV